MRTLRWTWPVLVAVALVALPWGCWLAHPVRELNVVVVDKTVPYRNWREHAALFWLLGHMKLVGPHGSGYRADAHYLGAEPGPEPGDPPQRTRDLTDRAAAGADVLYLVDTYGVYRDDLVSGPAMRTALERSPRIYGGLGLDEARLAASVPASGRTLVVEFNTLASPTPEPARTEMESVLGVRWTRWIGRHFSRLEETEEVPGWLRRNYEREWSAPWEFEGPGYVLLRGDAHVEVLRPGIEVERFGLTLEREQPVDPLMLDARDGVPYPYWFTVVEASSGTAVLARFRWHPTETGRERLAARGLPASFPAVSRRLEPGAGAAYYFAGDFADNPMPTVEVPLAGYREFKRWFEGVRLAPSETAFYWRFYVPMMHRLLEDAIRRKDGRNPAVTTKGAAWQGAS